MYKQNERKNSLPRTLYRIALHCEFIEQLCCVANNPEISVRLLEIKPGIHFPLHVGGWGMAEAEFGCAPSISSFGDVAWRGGPSAGQTILAVEGRPGEAEPNYMMHLVSSWMWCGSRSLTLCGQSTLYGHCQHPQRAVGGVLECIRGTYENLYTLW